eukprot:TRINITY_DN2744_c0_g1_i1.p1 TRINITY_DN2744_c0_g1~~TRINITY_DN2744_c0_g1_i1.p1  ORF type:complete len:249 (+),score=49.90 TRINITY_DN2744_c0_g1_i1:77-823(+)
MEKVATGESEVVAEVVSPTATPAKPSGSGSGSGSSGSGTCFFDMVPCVVPYDPSWPRLFEEEKAFLIDSVFASADTKPLITHFGSTSVPSMVAKPIIDIQVLTDEMPPSHTTLHNLHAAGYRTRTVVDVPQDTYMRFDKGDPIVTHCLHLRHTQRNADGWHSNLVLRAYLRTHPEEVQRYSNTKLSILQQPQLQPPQQQQTTSESGAEGSEDRKIGVTMIEYRDQKQAVVCDLAQRAREWAAAGNYTP